MNVTGTAVVVCYNQEPDNSHDDGDACSADGCKASTPPPPGPPAGHIASRVIHGSRGRGACVFTPHHRPRSKSTKSHPPPDRARGMRPSLIVLGSRSHSGMKHRRAGAVSRARRTQRAGAGPDYGRHSRLIKPNTHESDTSPFTTQSSRNVPSCTNPIFSRTRADATFRVSVSA
jgi:hypothetical protein